MRPTGWTVVAAIAIWMAFYGEAWALPELSSTFNPSPEKRPGPAPCKSCHLSSIGFEKNMYIDVRLPSGQSLVDKDGFAVIPWEPGETVSLVIVVGLSRQNLSGKVAGWFMNLPDGATVKPGTLWYGNRRINYERQGAFTADGVEYRVTGELTVTMGRRMIPMMTELWVGVGEKATEKYPGASQRKRTLGLRRLPVKWIAGPGVEGKESAIR